MKNLKEALQRVDEGSSITKSAFNKLHKSGKLGLVAGSVSKPAKDIFKILQAKSAKDIEKAKYVPTTKIDVSSQLGTGAVIKIFSDSIHGKTFYVVEQSLDSSKNPDVSWDTLDVFSTIYIEKD